MAEVDGHLEENTPHPGHVLGVPRGLGAVVGAGVGVEMQR